MGIRQVNVAVEGGRAHVSALASIKDRRRGMSYLWRLKVVTPDQKIFAKQVYFHQIFTMVEGGEMAPTFEDLIDIPPGESRVELTLYAFAKGTDLKFLDNEETANGYKMARAR